MSGFLGVFSRNFTRIKRFGSIGSQFYVGRRQLFVASSSPLTNGMSGSVISSGRSSHAHVWNSTIFSQRRSMFIQTQSTPNPLFLMLSPGKPVMEVGSADFPNAHTAMGSPLAKALFGIDGGARVYFGSDHITVTKLEEVSWNVLKPEIFAAVMDFYSSGQPLFYDSNMGASKDTAITENGVDINSWDRGLLCSTKPALYANVDCTPLIAAIVSRQAPVVKYLLEMGAKTDCKFSLGAWTWDKASGEELRVGASLAEPYNEAWCSVEYYEAKGEILKMLLGYISPDSEHHGRTLICHAVLCRNSGAIHVLLDAGANAEFCVRTNNGHEFCPLHMAARMGCLPIVKQFIEYGCDLNARTEMGETALMLCARANHHECFMELLAAGADLGLLNWAGQSAVSIAEDSGFESCVHQVLCATIKEGKKIKSSDLQVFSCLHFVARFGDAMVLQKLLEQSDINMNEQDRYGYSAAMVAAKEGHIEAFKVLIFAGADVKLKSKKGETVLILSQLSGIKDHLERVLLDAVLANILKEDEFKALHYVARRGNIEALGQLLKKGSAINAFDEDGYTPLMLAAREGHADACKILLQRGSDCHLVNARGETALALARRNNSSKIAEGVILDHLARKFVFAGEQLCKHTKRGKGAPHMKMVRMLKSGLLTWGKSSRRNVVCKEAGVGPSIAFRKNHSKGDADKPLIFRIVTIKGREIHFEAGSAANVELWVRGINLIAKEMSTLNFNIARK